MNTENNKNERKEKKRVLPLIWWFGGALFGGGLIVLSVLLANKNNQLETLEKKLGEKEIIFSNEKDSLSNILWITKNEYDSLRSEFEKMDAALANTTERFTRLTTLNSSTSQRADNCKDKYALLQASMEKQTEENKQLQSKLVALDNQIEQLQAQLQESENNINRQADVINKQNEKILTDSAAMAEDARLRKAEDVSGYVNITDLGGAFGLSVISVPYSRYFYSLNTVNGFVINKRFLTGIGVGINSYNGGLMAPVYLDLRYNFKESGFIPYVYNDAGFLLMFDNFKEPGFFMNPGIGVYRKLSSRVGINLSSGLYIQRTPLKSSFINFKLGVVFLGKKEE
ncbi:MAG: hypothetical protein JXJ22_06280 [Bacteroidales bacterium]|nr:hypothetical protein [Bacteroidales bacterium]